MMMCFNLVITFVKNKINIKRFFQKSKVNREGASKDGLFTSAVGTR